MKRLFPAGLALLVLFSPAPQNALAQSAGRTMRLTLLIDYARAGVVGDGTVLTPDGNPPDLSAWGFEHALPSWRGEDGRWNVRGRIQPARVISHDASGVYRLQIRSLALAPGDDLTLVIPFVNIDYAGIDPPPDNLQQLTATPSPDTPPALLGLKYGGGSGRAIDLEIPFTLIRKQIALTITPLVGEMLAGRSDGFRLSGRVAFDGLDDYAEFNRHCFNDPAARVLYRYRVADLLFSLDAPPRYNSGLLNAIYQFKPTSSIVSVDLATCRFNGKTGHVEATFNGRALATQSGLQMPQAWLAADTPESNRESTTPDGSRAYELRLGDVVLAPGDVLTVTIPSAEIHDVTPPPTRFSFGYAQDKSFTRDRTSEIAYDGPARFALTIVYVPEAALILHQIPATARALVRSPETALRPFMDPRGAPVTWGLLIGALALIAVQWFARDSRWAMVLGAVGWPLAALAFFFGLRGAFGLLVLAALMYLFSLRNTTDAGAAARGCAAIALIFAAMLLDSQAESLFTLLTTLELETTPVTPLIYLLLGLAPAALMAFPHGQFARLFPRATLPVALVLLVFSVFDVLQKSVLGLALIGLGILYLVDRMSRRRDQVTEAEVAAYLKAAWRGRLIPIGLVLMALFAAQNSLQSTTAVLGSTLGLWGALVMPALLLISIVQGLSSIGLLFIVVYPLLPFKSGYLRALTYAFFLLSIFVAGVGADERLVSTFDTLIIGRLVYYVSVPLLIGLYFDMLQFARAEQEKQQAEGKPAAEFTIEQAAPLYLKQLRGVIGTLVALASVVVPGAYTVIAGTPLVTTYFDILGKLVGLSLAT